MTLVLAVAVKNIKNAVGQLYNYINYGWKMKNLLKNISCNSNQEKENVLNELKKVCSQCKACELHKTRTTTVFADGSADAKIMLIGEAPGADEDATGIPFVGRAGQLLNTFLSEAGFDRKKDIYICNTLKCRPPQNRVPTNEEKIACQAYLAGQISTVKPKIILLCGSTAAQSFIQEDFKISQIRGKWLNIFDDIEVMPIFHPSYLLRNHSEEQGSPRWLMRKDLEAIKNKLAEIS